MANTELVAKMYDLFAKGDMNFVPFSGQFAY